MSPVAVAPEPILVALAEVNSTLAPFQSVGGVDLLQPVGVAIGWTVLTLVVGGLLLAGVSSSMRTIRNDAVERPDLAFATGFLVFFAPLVVASLPLFVVAYVVDHPAMLGLGALVSLPALLACGVLVVGGGTVGAIVVGDRIASRFGTDTPSLGRSLVIGSVVLGSSQLIPVLGALVLIGAVTVGTGAPVRRRFGPFGLGSDRTRDRRTETDRTPTSTRGWEAARSSDAAVRYSSEGDGAEIDPESPAPPTGRVDTGTGGANRSDRGWSDGDRPQNGDEDSRSDDHRAVGDWEWGSDGDREGDDGRAAEGDR